METMAELFTNPRQAVARFLLPRILGKFVDVSGIRAGKDLVVDGGLIKIRNLRLRREALEALQLPMAVASGNIDELELSLPPVKEIIFQINHLSRAEFSTPITLRISGVHIVAKPVDSLDFLLRSPEQIAEEAEKKIKKKLAELDEVWRRRFLSRAERCGVAVPPSLFEGDDGVLQRYVETALRYLVICVSKVHFQYVDATSDPARPFRLGLLLDSLEFTQCDQVCCRGGTKKQGSEGDGPGTPYPRTAGGKGGAGKAAGAAAGGHGSRGGDDEGEGAAAAGSSDARAASHVRLQHNKLSWSGLAVYLGRTDGAGGPSATATATPMRVRPVSSAASGGVGLSAGSQPRAGPASGAGAGHSSRGLGGLGGPSTHGESGARPHPPPPLRLASSARLLQRGASSLAMTYNEDAAYAEEGAGSLHSPAPTASNRASTTDPGAVAALRARYAWTGLDATALNFVCELSGAVTLAQHLPSRASGGLADVPLRPSANDPPRMRVDLTFDSLDLDIGEAQFAYMRSLASYLKTFEKTLRYKSFVRPLNRHVPLLSDVQAGRLREWLDHRRALAAAMTAAAKAAARGAVVTSSSVSGTGDVVAPASQSGSGAEGGGAPSQDAEAAAASAAALAAALEEATATAAASVGPPPPDPYEEIPPSVRAAIRERALGWWRFAVRCFRSDLAKRTGPGRATGDLLRREALRRHAVTLYKCAWKDDPRLRYLALPPTVLPGFSLVYTAGSGKGSSGSARGAANAAEAEWVADVAPFDTPPRIVTVDWNGCTEAGWGGADAGLASPSFRPDGARRLIERLERTLALEDLLLARVWAETELTLQYLRRLHARRMRVALARAVRLPLAGSRTAATTLQRVAASLQAGDGAASLVSHSGTLDKQLLARLVAPLHRARLALALELSGAGIPGTPLVLPATIFRAAPLRHPGAATSTPLQPSPPAAAAAPPAPVGVATPPASHMRLLNRFGASSRDSTLREGVQSHAAGTAAAGVAGVEQPFVGFLSSGEAGVLQDVDAEEATGGAARYGDASGGGAGAGRKGKKGFVKRLARLLHVPGGEEAGSGALGADGGAGSDGHAMTWGDALARAQGTGSADCELVAVGANLGLAVALRLGEASADSTTLPLLPPPLNAVSFGALGTLPTLGLFPTVGPHWDEDDYDDGTPRVTPSSIDFCRWWARGVLARAASPRGGFSRAPEGGLDSDEEGGPGASGGGGGGVETRSAARLPAQAATPVLLLGASPAPATSTSSSASAPYRALIDGARGLDCPTRIAAACQGVVVWDGELEKDAGLPLGYIHLDVALHVESLSATLRGYDGAPLLGVQAAGVGLTLRKCAGARRHIRFILGSLKLTQKRVDITAVQFNGSDVASGRAAALVPLSAPGSGTPLLLPAGTFTDVLSLQPSPASADAATANTNALIVTQAVLAAALCDEVTMRHVAAYLRAGSGTSPQHRAELAETSVLLQLWSCMTDYERQPDPADRLRLLEEAAGLLRLSYEHARARLAAAAAAAAAAGTASGATEGVAGEETELPVVFTPDKKAGSKKHKRGGGAGGAGGPDLGTEAAGALTLRFWASVPVQRAILSAAAAIPRVEVGHLAVDDLVPVSYLRPALAELETSLLASPIAGFLASSYCHTHGRYAHRCKAVGSRCVHQLSSHTTVPAAVCELSQYSGGMDGVADLPPYPAMQAGQAAAAAEAASIAATTSGSISYQPSVYFAVDESISLVPPEIEWSHWVDAEAEAVARGGSKAATGGGAASSLIGSVAAGAPQEARFSAAQFARAMGVPRAFKGPWWRPSLRQLGVAPLPGSGERGKLHRSSLQASPLKPSPAAMHTHARTPLSGASGPSFVTPTRVASGGVALAPALPPLDRELQLPGSAIRERFFVAVHIGSAGVMLGMDPSAGVAVDEALMSLHLSDGQGGEVWGSPTQSHTASTRGIATSSAAGKGAAGAMGSPGPTDVLATVPGLEGLPALSAPQHQHGLAGAFSALGGSTIFSLLSSNPTGPSIFATAPNEWPFTVMELVVQGDGASLSLRPLPRSLRGVTGSATSDDLFSSAGERPAAPIQVALSWDVEVSSLEGAEESTLRRLFVLDPVEAMAAEGKGGAGGAGGTGVASGRSGSAASHTALSRTQHIARMAAAASAGEAFGGGSGLSSGSGAKKAGAHTKGSYSGADVVHPSVRALHLIRKCGLVVSLGAKAQAAGMPHVILIAKDPAQRNAVVAKLNKLVEAATEYRAAWEMLRAARVVPVPPGSSRNTRSSTRGAGERDAAPAMSSAALVVKARVAPLVCTVSPAFAMGALAFFQRTGSVFEAALAEESSGHRWRGLTYPEEVKAAALRLGRLHHHGRIRNRRVAIARAAAAAAPGSSSSSTAAGDASVHGGSRPLTVSPVHPSGGGAEPWVLHAARRVTSAVVVDVVLDGVEIKLPALFEAPASAVGAGGEGEAQLRLWCPLFTNGGRASDTQTFVLRIPRLSVASRDGPSVAAAHALQGPSAGPEDTSLGIRASGASYFDAFAVKLGGGEALTFELQSIAQPGAAGSGQPASMHTHTLHGGSTPQQTSAAGPRKAPLLALSGASITLMETRVKRMASLPARLVSAAVGDVEATLPPVVLPPLAALAAAWGVVTDGLKAKREALSGAELAPVGYAGDDDGSESDSEAETEEGAGVPQAAAPAAPFPGHQLTQPVEDADFNHRLLSTRAVYVVGLSSVRLRLVPFAKGPGAASQAGPEVLAGPLLARVADVGAFTTAGPIVAKHLSADLETCSLRLPVIDAGADCPVSTVTVRGVGLGGDETSAASPGLHFGLATGDIISHIRAEDGLNCDAHIKHAANVAIGVVDGAVGVVAVQRTRLLAEALAAGWKEAADAFKALTHYDTDADTVDEEEAEEEEGAPAAGGETESGVNGPLGVTSVTAGPDDAGSVSTPGTEGTDGATAARGGRSLSMRLATVRRAAMTIRAFAGSTSRASGGGTVAGQSTEGGAAEAPPSLPPPSAPQRQSFTAPSAAASASSLPPGLPPPPQALADGAPQPRTMGEAQLVKTRHDVNVNILRRLLVIDRRFARRVAAVLLPLSQIKVPPAVAEEDGEEAGSAEGGFAQETTAAAASETSAADGGVTSGAAGHHHHARRWAAASPATDLPAAPAVPPPTDASAAAAQDATVLVKMKLGHRSEVTIAAVALALMDDRSATLAAAFQGKPASGAATASASTPLAVAHLEAVSLVQIKPRVADAAATPESSGGVAVRVHPSPIVAAAVGRLSFVLADGRGLPDGGQVASYSPWTGVTGGVAAFQAEELAVIQHKPRARPQVDAPPAPEPPRPNPRLSVARGGSAAPAAVPGSAAPLASAAGSSSLPPCLRAFMQHATLMVEPDPLALPAWAQRFYYGIEAAAPAPAAGKQWRRGDASHTHLLTELLVLRSMDPDALALPVKVQPSSGAATGTGASPVLQATPEPGTDAAPVVAPSLLTATTLPYAPPLIQLVLRPDDENDLVTSVAVDTFDASLAAASRATAAAAAKAAGGGSGPLSDSFDGGGGDGDDDSDALDSDEGEDDEGEDDDGRTAVTGSRRPGSGRGGTGAGAASASPLLRDFRLPSVLCTPYGRLFRFPMVVEFYQLREAAHQAAVGGVHKLTDVNAGGVALKLDPLSVLTLKAWADEATAAAKLMSAPASAPLVHATNAPETAAAFSPTAGNSNGSAASAQPPLLPSPQPAASNAPALKSWGVTGVKSQQLLLCILGMATGAISPAAAEQATATQPQPTEPSVALRGCTIPFTDFLFGRFFFALNSVELRDGRRWSSTHIAAAYASAHDASPHREELLAELPLAYAMPMARVRRATQILDCPQPIRRVPPAADLDLETTGEAPEEGSHAPAPEKTPLAYRTALAQRVGALGSFEKAVAALNLAIVGSGGGNAQFSAALVAGVAGKHPTVGFSAADASALDRSGAESSAGGVEAAPGAATEGVAAAFSPSWKRGGRQRAATMAVAASAGGGSEASAFGLGDGGVDGGASFYGKQAQQRGGSTTGSGGPGSVASRARSATGGRSGANAPRTLAAALNLNPSDVTTAFAAVSDPLWPHRVVLMPSRPLWAPALLPGMPSSAVLVQSGAQGGGGGPASADVSSGIVNKGAASSGASTAGDTATPRSEAPPPAAASAPSAGLGPLGGARRTNRSATIAGDGDAASVLSGVTSRTSDWRTLRAAVLGGGGTGGVGTGVSGGGGAASRLGRSRAGSVAGSTTGGMSSAAAAPTAALPAATQIMESAEVIEGTTRARGAAAAAAGAGGFLTLPWGVDAAVGPCPSFFLMHAHARTIVHASWLQTLRAAVAVRLGVSSAAGSSDGAEGDGSGSRSPALGPKSVSEPPAAIMTTRPINRGITSAGSVVSGATVLKSRPTAGSVAGTLTRGSGGGGGGLHGNKALELDAAMAEVTGLIEGPEEDASGAGGMPSGGAADAALGLTGVPVRRRSFAAVLAAHMLARDAHQGSSSSGVSGAGGPGAGSANATAAPRGAATSSVPAPPLLPTPRGPTSARFLRSIENIIAQIKTQRAEMEAALDRPMLVLSLTSPIKAAEGPTAQLAALRREALRRYGDRVEAAEAEGDAVPLPGTAPVDLDTASHIRLFVRGATYIQMKRWAEEVKACTAGLKAVLEGEKIWRASYTPRHAVFDYTVVEAEQTRVILVPGGRLDHKSLALYFGHISVRNALLHRIIPHPDAAAGASASASAGAASTVPVSGLRREQRPRYASAGADAAASAAGVGNNGGAPPVGAVVYNVVPPATATTLPVPLERMLVDIQRMEVVLMEPTHPAEKLAWGDQTGIPRPPGEPWSSPLALPVPDATDPRLRLWAPVPACAGAGTSKDDTATAASTSASGLTCPALFTRILSGDRATVTYDSPFGAVYRAISPVSADIDFRLFGVGDLRLAMPQMDAVNTLVKVNTRDPSRLFRILPALLQDSSVRMNIGISTAVPPPLLPHQSGSSVSSMPPPGPTACLTLSMVDLRTPGGLSYFVARPFPSDTNWLPNGFLNPPTGPDVSLLLQGQLFYLPSLPRPRSDALVSVPKGGSRGGDAAAPLALTHWPTPSFIQKAAPEGSSLITELDASAGALAVRVGPPQALDAAGIALEAAAAESSGAASGLGLKGVTAALSAGAALLAKQATGSDGSSTGRGSGAAAPSASSNATPAAAALMEAARHLGALSHAVARAAAAAQQEVGDAQSAAALLAAAYSDAVSLAHTLAAQRNDALQEAAALRQELSVLRLESALKHHNELTSAGAVVPLTGGPPALMPPPPPATPPARMEAGGGGSTGQATSEVPGQQLQQQPRLALEDSVPSTSTALVVSAAPPAPATSRVVAALAGLVAQTRVLIRTHPNAVSILSVAAALCVVAALVRLWEALAAASRGGHVDL